MRDAFGCTMVNAQERERAKKWLSNKRKESQKRERERERGRREREEE